MATIRSTLGIYDQMSGVLNGITRSLNLTLSAMDDMQRSVDQTFDPATINAARSAIQETEAAMKMLPPPIDDSIKVQEELNDELNRGSDAAQSLGKRIAGIAAAYLSIRKIKGVFADLTDVGMQFNAHMQSSEVAFTTMLGSAERAKEFLDELYAFNMTTPFAFPDWVTAARNLTAFGMAQENIIPVLSAIGDVTGGIGGGSQELLQIADAFGAIQVAGRVSMNEINRLQTASVPALKIFANEMGESVDEVRKKISSGAIDSNKAIDMLLRGIREGTDGIAGPTAAFGGMMDNVRSTWTGAVGSMRAAWRDAGGDFTGRFLEPTTTFIRNLTAMFRQLPAGLAPIGDSISRIIETINSAFEDNKINQFINIFLNGILLMTLATEHGVSFIVDHLDVVMNILVALGIAATVFATKWAVGWAIAAWPVFATIGAITLLITILTKMGVTADVVLGYVGGMFGSTFATIHNGVAFTWNLFLAFAEFLNNLFIDPVYAIKKLFFDLVKEITDYFNNMLNSLIDGINWVIEKINQFTGTEFELLARVEGSYIEQFRPESNRDVVDLSRFRLEQMDYSEAFESGYDRGNRLLSGLESAVRNLGDSEFSTDFTSMLDNLNVNRVNEVGRIRDDVDISSEDLKMMRELAEVQNIQNFVTLTPQISVQTGDIRETADTDEVIERIKVVLEEEIVSSAKGIYA